MTHLTDYLETQVDRHRDALIRDGRALAGHLTDIAAALERRDYPVSELGEIQSRGTMFDARCARYSEAKEALLAARTLEGRDDALG